MTLLRSGCDTESAIVARLPARQALDVKFAFAGTTPCYKVVATMNGRIVSGYLSPGDLEDAGQFDRERQAGTDTSGEIKVITTRLTEVRQRVASIPHGGPEVKAALDAMERNEPSRALTLLDSVVHSRPDPNVLALAGVAAWRNDEPTLALDYWRRSLDMRPDPDVRSLLDAVQRETAGDRSTGKMIGLRVLLRYDPEIVSAELARGMVLALDTEIERIAAQLGCEARERLVAVVQSRQAYLASTGAAEWSGGRYDGRVRVALLEESAVGPRTRRLFAHELAHACLANLGQWPAWLQEGLAQRLSGDHLEATAQKRVQALLAAKRYTKLEDLGRGFSSLNPQTAEASYMLALYAVDLLLESHRDVGIRNILANPSLFTQFTTELNAKLGL